MDARNVLSCIRVSGEQQIDRTGIPRQISGIAQINRENNLVVAPDDEYKFEGLSGASVEKFPRYREMLKRLEDPKIAGIVFSDVSRLFRPEFVDQLAISKPFREHGKLMFYEDGVLDLRKARDQDIFVTEARNAGAYRKRLIKNTQWGKNERRGHGNCKSDSLPRGVVFVPHPKVAEELVTGHFEYSRDPGTHELDFWSLRIKDAFRRIRDGEAQAVVARDLKFSSPQNLKNALRSRWWLGEKVVKNYRVGRKMNNDGTIYDGKRVPRENPLGGTANFNEPPLIETELFDAVQVILDDRHKTWTRQKSASSKDLVPFLGGSVVYCGTCGMRMYPKPVKHKTTIRYYMCSSRANYHKPCAMPMIRQEIIDRQIRVFVTIRLTNRQYIQTLLPDQPATANRELINKQILQLEKKKGGLYEKIGDDNYDQDLLDAMINANQIKIQQLQEQLLVAPKPATFDPLAIRKRFLNFTKLEITKQKELVRMTFSKIIVDEEGSIIRQTLR